MEKQLRDKMNASFYRDIDSALFTYTVCCGYIKTGSYDNITQAIKELNAIPYRMVFRLPAIKFLLSCASYKLNRFRIAQETLGALFYLLETKSTIERFFYPGTEIIIPETDLETLLSQAKQLDWDCRGSQHLPIAVCRFERCLELSSHFYPSRFMYHNDHDFFGYVSVVCEEKCAVEYHINCWAAYKESKLTSTGKLTDQGYLGQPCPSNNCVRGGSSSSIVIISVYDSTGKLKYCVDSRLKVDTKMEPQKEVPDKNKHVKISANVAEVTPNKRSSFTEELNKTKTQQKPVSASTSSSPDGDRNETDEFSPECLNRLNELRVFWRSQSFTDPSIVQFDEQVAGFYDSYGPESDVKSFVISMFREILFVEGHQKVRDVKERWMNAEEFRDVRIFLNDSERICDVLLESDDFYIIEDILSLRAQLPWLYHDVKVSTLEALMFVNKELLAPKVEPTSSSTPGQQTVHLEDSSSSEGDCTGGASVPSSEDEGDSETMDDHDSENEGSLALASPEKGFNNIEEQQKEVHTAFMADSSEEERKVYGMGEREKNCITYKDSSVQTESDPSLDGEFEESKRLFNYIRLQNTLFLGFFQKHYPLMPLITSDQTENMKRENEANTDDAGSLVSLNWFLTQSLTGAFEDNLKKFQFLIETVLSESISTQIDHIFKLLRSRYTEKMADYERFCNKFCTNSTKTLDCWDEINGSTKQCRRMLHMLDCKENDFKLKHHNLMCKLTESGMISVQDVQELLKLDFDHDADLKLKVSTIEEVFISLLKTAGRELQEKNQEIFLNIIRTKEKQQGINQQPV